MCEMPKKCLTERAYNDPKFFLQELYRKSWTHNRTEGLLCKLLWKLLSLYLNVGALTQIYVSNADFQDEQYFFQEILL